MSDKNKDLNLDGREIPLLVMLIGGSAWYKYGFAVKAWFYNNLIMIVLAVISIFVICGYICVRRYQKKHEEEINRLKRLREARAPSQAEKYYYQNNKSRGVDLE